MKRFVCIILICFMTTIFCGCETTDTEIANALEGNMTRLVYSVGYLDSISADEINSLVNGGSSYFYNSSLYNGTQALDNLVDDPSLDAVSNTSSGGLEATPLTANNTFRSRTYSSDLSPISSSSLSASNPTYLSGVVNISLLETSADDLNEILLEISQRRGIIMLYCTDLRSGRASLLAEDKVALNEYIDIIKETTNYLNNNAGSLTNHYNNISSVALNENYGEIINARLIKANETLKTRYAKLDTCLDSLAAITNILVSRLGPTYTDLYNSSLISGLNETNINNISSALATNDTFGDNAITQNQNASENIGLELDNDYIYNNSGNTNLYGGCCGSCQDGSNCCCGGTIQNGYSASLNSGLCNTQNYNYSYGSALGDCCGVLNKNNNAPCCDNGLGDNMTINTGLTRNVNPASLDTSSGLPINPINNKLSSLENEGVNDVDIATSPPQINPSFQANSTQTPTQEEIALNGGLIKNTQVAPASINKVFDDSFNSRTLDYKDKNRTISDDSVIHLPHTAIPNLSEPEITESEKELTPDLLPFTCEDSLCEKPLLKELGLISFAPIRFQEDMPIMNVPRK